MLAQPASAANVTERATLCRICRMDEGLSAAVGQAMVEKVVGLTGEFAGRATGVAALRESRFAGEVTAGCDSKNVSTARQAADGAHRWQDRPKV